MQRIRGSTEDQLLVAEQAAMQRHLQRARLALTGLALLVLVGPCFVVAAVFA